MDSGPLNTRYTSNAARTSERINIAYRGRVIANNVDEEAEKITVIALLISRLFSNISETKRGIHAIEITEAQKRFTERMIKKSHVLITNDCTIASTNLKALSLSNLIIKKLKEMGISERRKPK